MSAEDMANKQLKEWRQAELKQDIEKIKSHELELLQMGSKIVLKTHKGEQVMDDPSVKKTEKTDIKLPDDIKLEQKIVKKDKYKVEGAKTWDHDKHEKPEKDCDVCSKKMTEDTFLVAKIEREKRRKEYKDHKGHKSHHKSSRHKARWAQIT